MVWKAALASQGYLIADGATGTELAARGLPPAAGRPICRSSSR